MKNLAKRAMGALRGVLGSLGILGALCAAPAPALAQGTADYPNRPIRFVVPWPAGGTADLVARMLGDRLSAALGQPVVVDNRAGAGGVIGTENVVRSPADGYTLLLGSTGPNSINVSLMSKLPYDPVKDLTAVTQVTALPLVLMAGAAVPASSVKELVALAKAQPNSLSVASVGAGSAQHLSGEIFKSMAGVQWTHIPYKGSVPAFTDLIGGQVQLAFDNIPAGLPHLRSGKIKALAVTSASRAAILPEVPTVAEAGLPGYEAVAWQNVMVAAGTPRPIVERLNQELVKILKAPEVRSRLAEMGAIVVGSSVDEANAHVRNEVAKWAAAVKAAGVKLE